jgi:hypothetical protein
MSNVKEPPSLPDVTDEAGNTPGWVPLLGLAILCLVALLIAARQAIGPQAPAGEVADGADAGTASADTQAPVVAEPAAVAKPVEPAKVAQPAAVEARPTGQPIEIRPVEPGGQPIRLERVDPSALPRGAQPIEVR